METYTCVKMIVPSDGGDFIGLLNPPTTTRDDDNEGDMPDGSVKVNKIDVPSDPSKSTSANQQMSVFSIKRAKAERLIDFALFAANISQLRIVLYSGRQGIHLYAFVLTCLCVSIIGQMLFAIITIVIQSRNSDLETHNVMHYEDNMKNYGRKSSIWIIFVNKLLFCLVFIVTALNVCISIFISDNGSAPS